MNAVPREVSTPGHDVLGDLVEFPVEGDAVLKNGVLGNLFSISLDQDFHVGTRPGEDPIQYERILSVETSPTSALSLYRFKVWWMRPCWGTKLPSETILLLDQPSADSADYRLLLAVPLPIESDDSLTGFASASLRSSPPINIVLCSNYRITGVYTGKGRDPYALIRDGFRLATSVWYNGDAATNLLPTKGTLCKSLGWCSWNAFYTDVTGSKVVDAVRELKMEHDILSDG